MLFNGLTNHLPETVGYGKTQVLSRHLTCLEHTRSACTIKNRDFSSHQSNQTNDAFTSFEMTCIVKTIITKHVNVCSLLEKFRLPEHFFFISFYCIYALTWVTYDERSISLLNGYTVTSIEAPTIHTEAYHSTRIASVQACNRMHYI